MARSITVSESLVVARSPEDVWDFTQDYSRRHEWDASILEATVQESEPVPRVRIRARGGLDATFRYKLYRRPVQTSLAMEDVSSAMIAGGGGSWSYAAVDGGTLWTQTNTVVLREGWLTAMLAPLMRYGLASSTRRAMAKAKRMLEAG